MRHLIISLLVLVLVACGGGGSKSSMISMPVIPEPKIPVIQKPEVEVSEPEVSEPVVVESEPVVVEPEPVVVEPEFGSENGAHLQPLNFGPRNTGPALPQQSLDDAKQTPIRKPLHDQDLFVGAPGAGGGVLGIGDSRFEYEGVYNGVHVSHGRMQQGLSRNQIIGYLLQFETPRGDPGLSSFVNPPVISFAQGTSTEFKDYAVRVIQEFNSQLPIDFQLRVSSNPTPTGSGLVPNGQIAIRFAEGNYPSGFSPSSLGNTVNIKNLQQRSAFVYLNVDRIRLAVSQLSPHIPAVTFEKAMMNMFAHEMLHALGFEGGRGHVNFDLQKNTIMHTTPLPTAFGVGIQGLGSSSTGSAVLYPIDREALSAVYAKLAPGASAFDLGSWDDEAAHLRGDLAIADSGGLISFGVSHRNGIGKPWAYGPIPKTDLIANPELSGNVTWNGLLLGFTPSVESVTGDADLTLNLETLSGDLNFTDLSFFKSNRQWGDGDLSYNIRAEGNTFRQTGGDSGAVTGVFFGNQHQGMGGVLRRTDLDAAFGGKR